MSQFLEIYNWSFLKINISETNLIEGLVMFKKRKTETL